MPIVNEVFGFIKEQLSVLQTFWKENGDQIIQAVQNAFNIIMAIVSVCHAGRVILN